MADRDELELRLVTTLVPMLFAVATFSAGVVSALRIDPHITIIDELLSFLAGFSVFTAATLMDSQLDKQGKTWTCRLQFLNHGYVCFCAVMGLVTFMIPVLYSAKQSGSVVIFGWKDSFIFFIGGGICLFFKMMTLETTWNSWFWLMIIFYGLSIAELHSPFLDPLIAHLRVIFGGP